jgi:hypothetical protein
MGKGQEEEENQREVVTVKVISGVYDPAGTVTDTPWKRYCNGTSSRPLEPLKNATLPDVGIVIQPVPPVIGPVTHLGVPSPVLLI